MSKSFLRQVVDLYTAPTEAGNLVNYCFVTPSKRGARFLRLELHRSLKENYRNSGATTPIIEPTAMAMSELMSSFTRGVQPSHLELLLILYQAYCAVMTERGHQGQTKSFDRFRFWGDVMLSDFDDVDMNLVDPDQIFANVEHLKEIKTKYLTSKQLSVIRRYWRLYDDDDVRADEPVSEDEAEDGDKFWEHVGANGKDSDKNRKKFLFLWEILGDVHKKFRDALREKHFYTPGMAYREGSAALKEMGADELPYERYIFVGFNVVTVSELAVFNRFKQIGRMDFYCDLGSPTFFEHPEAVSGKKFTHVTREMINWSNSATRYVGRNAMHYPSRYPICYYDATQQPEIEVCEVASCVRQCKEAGEVLRGWLEDGTIARPGNAINTAVIISDPSLLIPMLHSVPEKIKRMNLSMGLPRRMTDISGLLNDIVNMQLNRRRVKGVETYFYEDVLAVMENELVKSLDGVKARAVAEEIKNSHLFRYPIPQKEDREPTLVNLVLSSPDPKDYLSVLRYAVDILESVKRLKWPKSEDSQDSEEPQNIYTFDRIPLEEILSEVKDAGELLAQYKVSVTGDTYMHLVRNIANQGTIEYIGEPLRGLQLVGMNETRSIDFENIIMLAMNERIYPPRRAPRTFIPGTLRQAYGLPTHDHRDSIYSYAFYRVLSRARRVRIYYDGRTKDIRHIGPSRYLDQLRILGAYPNCHFHVLPNRPVSAEDGKIVIPKDTSLLEPFFDKRKETKRNLSASAIKDYMQCSLRFYLRYVRKMNPDEELSETIDDIAVGQAVHFTLEKLYKHIAFHRGNIITDQIIDEACDPASALNRRIGKYMTIGINREFRHIANPYHWLDPVPGHAGMVREFAIQMVLAMLQREKQHTPFMFFAAEYTRTYSWPVNGRLLNFKLKIDRIDILRNTEGEPQWRFVDYKTGGDKTEYANNDKLFDGSHDVQAIFQLLLYSEAFARFDQKCINSGMKDIMPQIYQLRSVRNQPLAPIKGPNNQTIYTYKQVSEEFWPLMEEKIAEIFNPDVPYEQTKKEQRCKICPYAILCDREPKTDPLTQ